MPNTVTITNPQVNGQPVQNGSRVLKTTANVTGGAVTGTAIDVTSDVTTISLINTGTLDNAATLALQGQINGSSFFPIFVNGSAKTWSGTQINAGLIEQIPTKVNQIRFVLTPGTTTGANGVIVRALD